MKKLLSALMLASLLILPLTSVAVADHLDPVQTEEVTTDSFSGNVPAESDLSASISPVLHAVVLSALNHPDTDVPVASWESLYNMLSMYGQLDERSEYEDERLVLPAETVSDYASALVPNLSQLGELPEELSDRIVYDAERDCYLVTCGEDSLSQIQLDSTKSVDGGICLTGSLVYLVDGSALAQFEAVLTPVDNLFGFRVSSMEMVA
jgi:hypothetical protein